MPQFILKIDLPDGSKGDDLSNEDVGDLLIHTGTKIMAGWYPEGNIISHGNVVGHYEVVDS